MRNVLADGQVLMQAASKGLMRVRHCSWYEPDGDGRMHAHTLQDEIIIVDEFTGRTMPGRRWGDGLHQAVEAKEGVPIQDETVTLASISYQVSNRCR